jgi:hypothetical protein
MGDDGYHRPAEFSVMRTLVLAEAGLRTDFITRVKKTHQGKSGQAYDE